MSDRRSALHAVLGLGALVVAILLLGATPALAHHKDGHDGGPGASNAGSSSQDSSGDSDAGENGQNQGKSRANGSNGQGHDESDDNSTEGSSSAQSGSSSSQNRASASEKSDSDGSGSNAEEAQERAGGPAKGCAQEDEADDDNPYGSTCDGDASENGNGNGGAGGRPCAGCVGSADNKNPPGQAPNGTDHNNGYECDGNQGISAAKGHKGDPGTGNPAHTGCQPEDDHDGDDDDDDDGDKPGPCDADKDRPGIQPCKDEVKPNIIINPNEPKQADQVLPNLIIAGPLPVPPQVAAVPPTPQPGALPVTGPATLPRWALLGFALILLGLMLVRRRKLA